MFHIESSIDIKAAPDDVWALMGDVGRYPEWVEFTERVLEEPAGGLAMGAVYREYGGVPPFKGESRWEVLHFDPPRRQVHRGTDVAMRFLLEITLEPVEDGTRLYQTLDLTPKWFAWPLSLAMWPLVMKRRGFAALRATQANAKRLLEGGSAG